MKKSIIAAFAAAALCASTFAAEFDFSGYVRAGINTTLNAPNTDGDKEVKATSTAKWLEGDYFGGKSRVRINADLTSEDGNSGVKFRYQYTGAFDEFTSTKDEVKYAYAWGKAFDGKVLAGAGKIGDKYITSDGWEGFSLIDGKTGVFAAYCPIEGLTLLGAAVNDYLITEEVLQADDTKKEEKKFDKRAGVFGASYGTDLYSVKGAYSPAGRYYVNVNYTPSNLLVALEYAYESKDAIKEHAGVWYDTEKTFCEQIEYTGIDKLLLAGESYQFIDDKDNLKVTITPAVKYSINDLFAVTAEATFNVKDETVDDFDSYATYVPGIELNFTKDFVVNAYASISSDSDQACNIVGVGCKKSF